MLAGLMQTTPLRVIDILSYAAAAHGEREIVSRLVDEPLWRYNYRGLIARTARCANALKRLGARPGDRIATLCWNTHRHLELSFRHHIVAGGIFKEISFLSAHCLHRSCCCGQGAGTAGIMVPLGLFPDSNRFQLERKLYDP